MRRKSRYEQAGEAPESGQAIDDFLISRLSEKIRTLAAYYRRIIEERCRQEPAFAHELATWFGDQGWSFAWQPVDFEKAARQAAYLVANRILFYVLLQATRHQELDPLEMPGRLGDKAALDRTLQGYFSETLRLDYQAIFRPGFLDRIAFPDDKEVIEQMRELVTMLGRYDFTKLGYDVLGRIFERLIPQCERHQLGQYFTGPDVIDLILRFCLRHADDKVLDPSCGAGAFLVRAYQHKKLTDGRKSHEEILETLWGAEIARFPAHLAAINLAIKDLGAGRNSPNILQEDFFALPVEDDVAKLPERHGKKVTAGNGQQERGSVALPQPFDAIIGNPPYTRQEEIGSIVPEDGLYKRNLITRALQDSGGKPVAGISERAGVHAYFFVYGARLLKEGGYLGFIVAGSWLDAEFGKGLQEFFLKNYKVIAIIESKIERWFEEADVNTCIVILQKCSSARERRRNSVRFAYLKKPLRHFIPASLDSDDGQLERLRQADKLKKIILASDGFTDGEELRIHPVLQQRLWDEGFDSKNERYAGAKWGKYLRAPSVFFTILNKAEDLLVPLKSLAEVRRGITTGANEFFYLKREDISRHGIESRYLRPAIFSLKEVKGYKLDRRALTNHVIICNEAKQKLEGTNLLRYIERGEEREYDKRPTCAQRSPAPWYGLAKGWSCAPLIFPAKVGERMPVFVNDAVFEDKKLYGVTPKAPADKLVLAALLNSTLSRFFIEFTSRQLTGSQAIADIDVAVVEALPVVNIGKLNPGTRKRLVARFEMLAGTEAASVFNEIARSPEEVSLEKIKPERRGLDKIVMGDILGLSESEQLEIYRSLVDFVRSRLSKAGSFSARRRSKERIDVGALTRLITGRILNESRGRKTLGGFCAEVILSRHDLIARTLPERDGDTRVENGSSGWALYSGRNVINCRSEYEGRYLKIFLDAGSREVKVPEDDGCLALIVQELEALKGETDEVIDYYLKNVLDRRVRERVRRAVFKSILL